MNHLELRDGKPCDSKLRGGELDAAILPAFLVTSVVGDGALDLAESEVGDTVGAHDGDVVGDGARADEVELLLLTLHQRNITLYLHSLT